MKRTILRETVRIALEKLPRHPQYNYYPHFTFVVQSNKILEMGMNSDNAPPVHLGYMGQLKDGTPKTHSEYNAYRKVKGILNPNKGFEIVNIRLNRQPVMKMSAPCGCCYGFMQALGCTDCYFSTELGEFAHLTFAKD